MRVSGHLPRVLACVMGLGVALSAWSQPSRGAFQGIPIEPVGNVSISTEGDGYLDINLPGNNPQQHYLLIDPSNGETIEGTGMGCTLFLQAVDWPVNGSLLLGTGMPTSTAPRLVLSLTNVDGEVTQLSVIEAGQQGNRPVPLLLQGSRAPVDTINIYLPPLELFASDNEGKPGCWVSTVSPRIKHGKTGYVTIQNTKAGALDNSSFYLEFREPRYVGVPGEAPTLLESLVLLLPLDEVPVTMPVILAASGLGGQDGRIIIKASPVISTSLLDLTPTSFPNGRILESIQDESRGFSSIIRREGKPTLQLTGFAEAWIGINARMPQAPGIPILNVNPEWEEPAIDQIVRARAKEVDDLAGEPDDVLLRMGPPVGNTGPVDIGSIIFGELSSTSDPGEPVETGTSSLGFYSPGHVTESLFVTYLSEDPETGVRQWLISYDSRYHDGQVFRTRVEVVKSNLIADTSARWNGQLDIRWKLDSVTVKFPVAVTFMDPETGQSYAGTELTFRGIEKKDIWRKMVFVKPSRGQKEDSPIYVPVEIYPSVQLGKGIKGRGSPTFREVGDPFCLELPFEGGSDFQWYKNGVPLAGETSPELCFSNPVEEDSGTYRVRLNAPDGSKSQVEYTFYVVVANSVPASGTLGLLAAACSVGLAGILWLWRKRRNAS
ncbi:MAG TPA: hypothetical protein PK379_04250 [Candidatus Hydrogenedentes bacterium]|nr:hypothetical protein [Candidatus Hydrogenedentota bacterium]HOK89215.1 hypothetical protein [Candidatus Hydrogenedentota bacterium]